MNLLTMISGNTELWNIPLQSLIAFEQMQLFSKSNDYLLINTLNEDIQHCLIINTIHAKQEVSSVEKALKENKPFVIYGMHHYDSSLLRKYQQLKKLGAGLIYVYGGGMFEWLLLQDIYGNEQFSTSGNELDILKYKPC
jgi:hypothetical protein